ncbi:hypothetical protein COV22_04410, partial [Candidatus Woesearchaeota archaeon CG10_big_fil_rev_8_21_14_0_10_47_5]
MAEFQKRQTAYKVRIAGILNGSYVRKEGWQPNYVTTPSGRRVSRVNIIATVVSKTDEGDAFVLDDGSGVITLRSFGPDSAIGPELGVGQTLLVVGRVREFSSQKYLIPEIIRGIDDMRWIRQRQLEIELQSIKGLDKPEASEESEEAHAVVDEETVNQNTPSQRIYEIVKTLDSGEGADFEGVIARAASEGITSPEKLIQSLIEGGEIFQVRAGKL